MAKTVYYHHPCTDGLVAAWAFRECFGKDIRFIPLAHATPLLDGDVVDRDVHFLDIVPSSEVYKDIVGKARKVEVVDHHATAHPTLLEVEGATVFYDENRSGAGLSWDVYGGPNRPWIVNYAESLDLYRHNLPNSRAVAAALSQCHTMDDIDAFYEKGLEQAIRDGEILLELHRQEVEATLAQVTLYNLPGIDVPVPGVGCPRNVTSDVLNRASVGFLFAFSWRPTEDGRWAYSFRNTKDGVDLSVLIPKVFGGGGGHPHASGFVSDRLIHTKYEF